MADSSVWIDHFRTANPHLAQAAAEGRLLQHPYVNIELALGMIPRRETTLADLGRIAQARVLTADELGNFIEQHSISGTGLGMVDASLLAAATTTADTRLWTRDKRLAAQAERLGIAYQP